MPERKLTYCPNCKANAVGLWTDTTSVNWCENGHVTVVLLADPPKLVHTF